MAKTDLRHVPLKQVRANPAALRAVDMNSPRFHEFIESVRSKGVLTPILVREKTDNDTGSKYLALVDGLHRFTAANELDLETIPVHIVTATDQEALEDQIVANVHQIQTKAASFADGLDRLLKLDETLTVPALATKIGKSESWLTKRLKLTRLPDKIKELVDEGKINVTNAQALADLPHDEIPEYLDRAASQTPAVFVPLAQKRAQEVKDAQKQGRQAPKPTGFVPTPNLRGLAHLRKELEDGFAVGKAHINAYGAETPLDGWKLAIEWAINMDPTSIKLQKEAYDKAQEEKARKREERKNERLNKKLEESAELAVSVED